MRLSRLMKANKSNKPVKKIMYKTKDDYRQELVEEL